MLAHELGHHVHKHILKSIAVQAGVTLAGFWAANWILHYAMERRHFFDTLSDFANLPLLVLVSTALSLALLPALNAFSRYNERQADRYAFQSIASIQPFISSPIYARTDGYLKTWDFDIGAHVKAGQLLATIQSPEVDEQLAQARSTFSRSIS